MRSVSRRTIAIAPASSALVLILWVVIAISRDRPVAYDDITDHFKYGSIGSEPGVSLMRPVGGVLPPLSVFTALPSICPEKLPGGYASLGFIFEKGHTLPVGVSQRRRIGIDHVGLNRSEEHTSELQPPYVI